MTFEIDVNGRTHGVTIEPLDGAGPRGGSFRVSVDGAPHEVLALETDLGLTLQFTDGRVLDAAVSEHARGEWLVQLPHVTVTAVVDGRRQGRGPAGPASLAGEQRVTAPMPGRIVRVLVQAGDEVAEGQGLVVVEAMKMENELVSPKAGRVKEVAVSEGVSVEAGRVLAIVE